MKRSEINEAIIEMEELIRKHGFEIPPFCRWTPEEWKQKNSEYDEIRDNMLGWDITDYGLNDFSKTGFSLITIRNGNRHMDGKYAKPYAEKLLMVRDGQHAPMHYHAYKMEDIINRGGGNVLITVYNSAEDGQLSDTDVKVTQDGRTHWVSAGTAVKLEPGESITIYPYMYHDFNVESGTGAVLLGEVSMCNDDNTDNFFYEPVGRFPEIEEDVPPYRLLCTEYPAAAKPEGRNHSHDHTHSHPDDQEYAETDDGSRHSHTHAHNHPNAKAVSNRLARATGHLESVKRMVDNGEDCAQILIQLAAVRSAINNAGKVLLSDHINHCMIDAVENKDYDKITELNETIQRFVK